MGLSFHNKTNLILYLVVAYYDPQCQDEGNIPWRKRGWWTIQPNETVNVWNGSANNKEFLYFAEDSNRTVSWSGDRYTHIPYTEFTRCWNITGNESGRRLGLRVFKATADNYTKNLILN